MQRYEHFPSRRGILGLICHLTVIARPAISRNTNGPANILSTQTYLHIYTRCSLLILLKHNTQNNCMGVFWYFSLPQLCCTVWAITRVTSYISPVTSLYPVFAPVYSSQPRPASWRWAARTANLDLSDRVCSGWAVCSCVEGGARGLLALVSSHLSITTFVPASGPRDHWAEGVTCFWYFTHHTTLFDLEYGMECICRCWRICQKWMT